MKNKRGALQLSINAVVVIIIAIVMLGLALTFVRSIFGGMIKQFEEVSAEVKAQMEQTLRERTEKAALNTNSVELKAGDSKIVYLGINNFLQNDVDFCIACPNCKKEWCTDGNKNFRDCRSFEEGDCKEAVYIKGLNVKTVDRGKIDVVPLTVEVKSTAEPDTYMIPMHIYGRDPDSDAAIEEVVDLYVTVK